LHAEYKKYILCQFGLKSTFSSTQICKMEFLFNRCGFWWAPSRTYWVVLWYYTQLPIWSET